MADYIIQSSNNQEKQTFLSCDNSIYVEGSKEIRVTANARYAVSSWSIAFNVTKLTGAGNTFFTQSGGITIDDSVLSDLVTGQSSFIIVTSDTTVYYDGYPVDVITALGNLLNANITIGTGDFAINNIILFDTVVDDLQAATMSENGGFIPASLEGNVLEFYPCQEQFSRTMVTGDIGLTKGLVLTDKALFSSVEMFGNYTANHASLFGYSDTEQGTGAEEEATDRKNFYNPDIRKIFTGKKYTASDSMRDSIVSFTEYDRTQSTTYLIRINFEDTFTATESIFATGDNTTGTSTRGIQVFFNSSGDLAFRLANVNTTNDMVVAFRDVIFEKETLFIITYDGSSNANNVNAYQDNRQLTPDIIRNGLSGTVITGASQGNLGCDARAVPYANFLNRVLFNFEIINSVATASDIEFASKWKTFESLGKTYLLNVDFSKKESDLTTVPSTPTYTINPFKSGVAQTIVNGDGTYLEAKTNLPPLKECLEISTGKTVNFGNLGTIETIHFTLQSAANTITLFTFTGGSISINASDEITTSGLTGVTIYTNRREQNNFVLNAIQDIVISFDSQAVNAFNSTDDFDYLIRVGSKTTAFANDWMIHELCRNNVIGNSFNWNSIQDVQFRDNYNQYWLGQEDRISGANWTNELSGGNTATLTGFSIPADIIEIDSIR